MKICQGEGGQTAFPDIIADREFWQEGNAASLPQQADDKICISYFKKRMYFLLQGCQILLQNEAVAGILFCEQEGLADDLIQGQILPSSQRMIRTGHKEYFLRGI